MNRSKTESYQKVLLIRLGGIGDIIFTLPAVHMLRANLPDSQITYLTTKNFQDLLLGFPEINQVFTVDRGLYRRKKLHEILPACCGLTAQLRREAFDLVVDFQGFGETALLTWLTGARARWGVVRKKNRKICYTLGSTSQPNHHPVDFNRALLAMGGLTLTPPNNQFFLPKHALTQAKVLFHDWKYRNDQPTIFIQPFSHFSNKNWPLHKYLALADYWRKQGFQIIFGGGPSEVVQLKDAAAKYPISAGKADLLTNAGLMALSTLVIGNDTGLLHLAVAMNQRVVMLMGPTQPNKFGPYANLDWAITPQKGTDIAEISLAETIHAVTNTLSQLGLVGFREKH